MSQPRTASLYHATFDPVTAALVVLAAIATLLVAQAVLHAVGSIDTITIAGGELALVALPIALALRARSPAAVLGHARPRARFVVAAVLVGASIWYANLWIAHWVRFDDDRGLGNAIDRDALALTIVGFAFVPAACEELVFRGVLARALARRLPVIAAIAISAAVFALFHMRLVQLAPTFTLGLAFGAIAVRADSAIPTMIGHAINNAIAVAISRGHFADQLNWLFAHDRLSIPASFVLVATGVAIAIPRGVT